jgi:electron transport complex protein RnfC
MMGRYRVVERRKAGETRGDKGMGKGTGSGSGSGNGAEVQVILNGMMLGQEGREGDLVTGMTEAVSVREAVGNEWPTPCIACGWCVDVCPTALTPVHLMQLNHRPSAATLRTKDAQEARHCIGCGLCSYVCPTRLPLMEQVVSLRRKVGG